MKEEKKYDTKNILEHPFLENEEFQEVFSEFIEMRRKMRKPATERATKLLLLTLHKLSKDNVDVAIKIIDQSLIKNYLDFYEVKSPSIMTGDRDDSW